MAEQKMERSSNFPGLTWFDAYALSKEAVYLGNTCSREAIAKKLKVSHKTNSFRANISTAKQFSLINVDGETITPTPLAKELVMNDESENRQLKIQSFRSPRIYGELCDMYQSKALPSIEKLALVFMNKGVTTKSSTWAAQMFLESAQGLGFIRNGILDLDMQSVENNSESDVANQGRDEEKADDPKSTKEIYAQKNVDITGNYHKLEIPTEKPGVEATLLLPHNLSGDDIEFIEEMVGVLLKRYKKRILNSAYVSNTTGSRDIDIE
jgi:hypothetical protein